MVCIEPLDVGVNLRKKKKYSSYYLFNSIPAVSKLSLIL